MRTISTPITLDWKLPQDEEIKAALDYFRGRRAKEVVLTIILKLRTESRRKEQALLDAQCYVTNKTSAILEELREEPTNPRTDGAIACLLEMLHREHNGEKGDRTDILRDILAPGFNASIAPDEYTFSSKLRDGVYKNCAHMLLVWYLQITKNTSELTSSDNEPTDNSLENEQNQHASTSPSPRLVPTFTEVYQKWATRVSNYEAACRVRIPFGRHRGKCLDEVGKREVRWLKERLPSEETINQTLAHVNVLLSPSRAQTDARKEALLAEHPWWRTPHHQYEARPSKQRAVRARHIVQRRHDPPGSPVLLGEMSLTDLQKLRDQLREYQVFAPQFSEIRTAVDTFLDQRPPAYPRVLSVPSTDFERAKRQRLYETELRWFRDPFPSNTPTSKLIDYTPADLEALERKAIKRLYREAQAVEEPSLQPITFIRTMRPPTILSTFSLLYSQDKGSFKYVLAVSLHGRATPKEQRFKPQVKPGVTYRPILHTDRHPYDPAIVGNRAHFPWL